MLVKFLFFKKRKNVYDPNKYIKTCCILYERKGPNIEISVSDNGFKILLSGSA